MRVQPPGRLGAGGMGEGLARDRQPARSPGGNKESLPAGFTQGQRAPRPLRARGQTAGPAPSPQHRTSIFGLEEGTRNPRPRDGARRRSYARRAPGRRTLRWPTASPSRGRCRASKRRTQRTIHRDLAFTVQGSDRGTVKVLTGPAVHRSRRRRIYAGPSLSPAAMNSPTMMVMLGTQLGIILNSGLPWPPNRPAAARRQARRRLGLGVVL